MIDSRIDRISNWLFAVLLLFVAWYYNYQEVAFYQPQSIHKWRQSDCASIALNYYQGGMHFFKPEVHNLTSENGTSGKAFTSEMPFLYYSVAFLYKVFGPNVAIYRILNTLIFLLGLFYLFRLGKLITNDTYWSVFISMLFFTSPVLVYYGNNFLTNTSALAFSIIGWFYFVKFITTRLHKHLYISLLVFFFAASFKITALISLFAIGVVLLAEWLKIQRFIEPEKLFKQPVRILLILSLIVGVVIGWVVYARIQNTLNGCYYFSTVTFPIWELDKLEIQNVLEKIRKVWLTQYFHPSILIFIGITVLFIGSLFKKIPKLACWIVIMVFFEVLVFILLQFWTFADHDYYTIGLFVLPILLLLLGIYLLKSHYPKLANSYVVKVGMFFLLAYNVYYAKGELNKRYNGVWNDKDKFEDIYAIQLYLRQIGIQPMDTVISIPDYCHATLYLINQKGWTEYTDQSFNKGEKTYYNRDGAGIKKSIKNGARYLILNGLDQVYEKDYLQAFCFHKKGQFKNVFIFDLLASDTNYVIPVKEIKAALYCDAEILSADKQFFVNDSSVFEFGITQHAGEALNSDFSSCLNSTNPYGMTIRFNDVLRGESFMLRVWVKNIREASGTIVAAIDGENYSKTKVINHADNGWEQLELNLFITEKMEQKELILFLYNPSNDKAYFDDFEIVRYASILK